MKRLHRAGTAVPRRRRSLSAFLVGALAVVGIGAAGALGSGTTAATAAVVPVTITSSSLTGDSPVTQVGDELLFSVGFTIASGNPGDTFSITLPPELMNIGSLTFPIAPDYGTCTWSGQTANCTLTRSVTNGTGGMELMLRAVGSTSGGSTVTVGGTPVTVTPPGGSIQVPPGEVPTPGTYYLPAPTTPSKSGDVQGGYLRWMVLIPGNGSTVDFVDTLDESEPYNNQTFIPRTAQGWGWQLERSVIRVDGTYDNGPPTNGFNSVVQWTDDGGVEDCGLATGHPDYQTFCGTNAPGPVISEDGKALTISDLTLPAGATGYVYRLTYYTMSDEPWVDGDVYKNNAQVTWSDGSEEETDTVVVVRQGLAWLDQGSDFGRLDLSKIVLAEYGGLVPPTTEFTVEYRIGTGAWETATVTMSQPWSLTLPSLTQVTIREIDLPAIPGVTWEDYRLTNAAGNELPRNPDGSYTVTIPTWEWRWDPVYGWVQHRERVILQLVNPVETPVPDIQIIKTDENGNDANDEETRVDLSGSNGATGLVFTITNNGTEALKDVVVGDHVTQGSGTVTGLSCDFSPLGGPATGTEWVEGPFHVGDSFTCTAELTGVRADEPHTDLASVTAVGYYSDIPVDDDDPYNAFVQPELDYAKTSDPASGTRVNPGDTVTYTISASNDSGQTVTSAQMTDDLSGVLGDATLTNGPVLACEPSTVESCGVIEYDATERTLVWSATEDHPLDGIENATTRAVVTYSVLVDDDAVGPLRNVLVEPEEETEHPVSRSLAWTKVGPGGDALAGSEWRLTPVDENDAPIGEAVEITDCVAATPAECTGPDRDDAGGGFLITQLAPGRYELVETRAPVGYVIDVTPRYITLLEDLQITVHDDIVNEQQETPVIPLTGGVGSDMLWGAGAVLVLLMSGLGVWEWRRRSSAGAAHEA